MTDAQTIATIRALEEQRGRALLQQDWETLQNILATELAHIHANGSLENRHAYLDAVRNKLAVSAFRRESLDVRPLGSCALATGILVQTVHHRVTGETYHMRIATTQVWILERESWRQASFHATHIADTRADTASR